MSALKTISIIIAIIAVLAYQLHRPLPPCYDDIQSGYRVAIMYGVPTILGFGNFLESLGITTYYRYLRALIDYAIPPGKDTDDISSVDTKFDGVPVRVYLPTQRKPNGPALVYIHGGGWSICSVNMFDNFVRSIAVKINIVAISVDYRLAPESPYPAAIDDVEKAYRHFVSHAADYNVDTSRIAIAGDSAGGNLAAALAVRLRDSEAVSGKKTAAQAENRKSVLPKLQILLYPVLQSFNFSSVSALINKDDLALPRTAMMQFTLSYILGMDLYNTRIHSLSKQYLHEACYLPKYAHVQRVFTDSKKGDLRERILTDADRAFLSTFGKDASERQLLNPTCTIKDQETLDELHKRVGVIFNSDFSPLLTDSVEGLPPVYIISCGYDVLRDDSFLYAERLRDAGVPVEHTHYAKYCHGFFTSDSQNSLQYLREVFAKGNL